MQPLIRVGIIGVGNCASSLVQGVQYYARASERAGLQHPTCAGYSVSAVQFSAAFDVNQAKLGLDLSAALWAAPNNAHKFSDVPELGVPVHEGILADGIGTTCAAAIPSRGGADVQAIATHLEHTRTRILVNFLPTGSQRASEHYAEAALRAHCAFVNCIPASIARSPVWAARFEEAGLPLIGDDLKSQFGATLVHRALVDALSSNGVRLSNTYQIVGGGNMDFLNLSDPERITSKRATKVQGMLGDGSHDDQPAHHFGAEYMPFLSDRKLTFIGMEGEAFGGTRLELELRMSIEDSPSAAGNVLDAIRYAQRCLDLGVGGVVAPLTSLLMKAPPTPMRDADARQALEALGL